MHGLCVWVWSGVRSVDIVKLKLSQLRIKLKDEVLQQLLPHSAPSWILSYAENLTSFILQDGATEWHDYVPGTTQPPTHPP